MKWECGLACLAMMLNGLRLRDLLVSDLRTRCGVDRDGVSALEIVRTARDHGMRVRTVSLPRNDLRFVSLPAIVHWEFTHFLVVERWSHKYVDVVDPARGRCRFTEEEFDAGFTEVIILREPGEAFERPAAVPPGVTFRGYVRQFLRQAPGTSLQLLGVSLLLILLGLVLPILTAVMVDHVFPFGMRNVMEGNRSFSVEWVTFAGGGRWVR
ncbi:cysteine peptidase family C39 domain-containing protein [Streptomyces sp. NPDC051677]|uniref:cysteine peptidase family C39 domain-containing protein n=1 Tax=Streptomyces sp. NPDC051677 TaxID=3365669 RepID=UPI0037CF80E0